FAIAETEDAFCSLLSEFLSLIGIVHKVRAPSELMNIFRNWLRVSEGWLIIFDNVGQFDIINQFCQGHRNHVIITTRQWNCTSVGVYHPLRLESLRPEEPRQFLYRRTGRGPTIPPEEEQAADAICQSLAYLPLALELAGAHIAERDMRFATFVDWFW